MADTLYVGAGGFATIQEAVDAASDGDTIEVAAGTYVEQVVVDGIDNLTIRAADGAQVTIEAPADLVETARSSSDREIHGVLTVIDSANVVIDDIDVDGAGRGNTVDEGGGAGQANFYGIFYRNASGSLLDVDITAVRDPYPGGTAAGGEPLVSGVQRGVGLVVDNDSILAFAMTGGSISDFQKNATVFNRADLDVSGVTITGGGAQTINAQNGFQVSNSTGTISDNTITGIGYAGAANAYSAAILAFGNTDLHITGNSITGSNEDSLDAKVVGIYLFQSGSPNSGGSISGNNISDVDIGIGVYDDVTPNGILIENNDVTDIDTSDPFAAGVDFEPNAALATPFDVDGTAGDDILVGGAGHDVLSGLGGNDRLTGNGSNDTLSGGTGTDRASYDGARADYSVTMQTAGGRVIGFTAVSDNNSTNGNEGFDTLSSVEILEFSDRTFDTTQAVQLFDQNNQLLGTFDTIQEAIDLAQDNYTIRVAAGTFDEDLLIDVGVRILGARTGAVTGRDAANGVDETTIVGHAKVTAEDNVTLTGLRFLNDSTTTGGGPSNPTLQFLTGGGASGHQLTNSIFWSTVAGGANGVDDRAISTPLIADGQLTITGNLISGSAQGLFSTASWGRGIWFDGGGVNIDISDNIIEWTRSALTLDLAGGSFAFASNNNLRNLGTAFSIATSEDNLAAVGNDFSNVGDEFNFRNLSEDVIFDASSAVDDVTPVGGPNDLVVVLGGSGNDQLTGTSGADVLDANNRPGFLAVADQDTLDGGAGADFLFGRFGDDTLTGGFGLDTIDGGAGTDTAIVGTSASFTANGTSWTVSSGEGADTLTGVEIVVTRLGVTTLLVGSGGFATIQEAVDAASDGDTILVAAGTYVEQVIVDGIDNLTIRAASGAQVTIEAPADLVETARSSSDREVHGVLTVIGSTNVVIDDIDVDGAGRGNTVDEGGGAGQANFYGIFYRNSSGSLLDVDITGVRDPYPGGNAAGGEPLVSGVQRGVGLVVDNDSILAFTMTGGSISDFQKNATSFNRADLDVSGVTVTGGGAQTIIAQNGIQVANSTGTISGNTITGIGYAGPANAYSGAILAFGNTDLDIQDNFITGSNEDSLDAKVVGIYVFQSGGPNSGGSISGNIISHVDTGIGVYDDVTPNGILIENNTITDIDTTDPFAAGVDFAPDPSLATPHDVDGSAGDDFLGGGAGNDILSGLGGNDELTGNGGDDNLDGGGDGDTAVFAGNFADYTITAITDGDGHVTGFSAVVDDNAGDGDEGSDTLTGIEKLQFADATLDAGAPVQLFDDNGDLVGTFGTIQEAIDAAAADYSILVGAGTYAENLIVDVDGLTIEGLAGAVLQGTFLTDNGVAGDLNEWLKTAAAYDASAGDGVTVSADDVTLTGLTISGFNQGVVLGDGTDGLTLDDVALESNFTGIHKPGAADVTGFELLGGSISDGHLGMDIVRANGPDGIFDDVLIDGTSFADLNRKGIYAEALSNAHITNITMTNVGEFGGITATGALGRGGNGVNVNLKYGSYDNILIDNFTLTDVGSSDRDGAMAEGDTNGGAIVIAARDDAPTYSPNPASATNVIVRDGTIDGTSTGVQLGEPGKANATPDLLVENVAISDAQHTLKHGDIGNQSAATMTVTGTSGADSLIASGNSDGPFVIDGGAGEDTIATGSAADQIEGGADDDVIDGGGGIDTAIVGSGATYSANGANWTVTSSDGSDTLTNVEIVDDAAAGKVLLVGSGGFTTIQAAIDAAADGDTILVAAGTYDEDIVIDVGVTILGAQHGVSVDGRDAAAGTGESTIIGDAKVTAAAGVTIDGIRFLNDATTSGNGPSNPALAFQTGGGVGGHNVTNSIFWSTLAGGAGGVDDRAISVNAIADGLVTIADNLISGASQGQFSTASWGRAIWFDGGGVDLVATGNTILWSRTGLNLDMSGDSTADVSGNTFHGLGTGISVGVDADGLTVSDNDHQQVGDDFNFRNLTTGVTFDAGEAIDTLTPVGNANDFVVVLGGSGADDLTGTAGADVLDGNNHPTLGSATDADTLDGAGGDDLLFGRGGDDELDGGTGIDTLTGGAGDDELAGGSEIDTAVYAGNIADYTITSITDGDGRVTGFSAVVDDNAVGGDEGSDTLTGIERLQFADATLDSGDPVQLFDDNGDLVGTFGTIQEAIDAAAIDYSILVGAGTYAENLIVDVDGLTIEGLSGAVLQGTFLTDNGVAGDLNEWLKTAAAYDASAGDGVTVSADDVTLTGLTISGFNQGVVLGDGTDGLTLDDVALESNFTGIHKPGTADVTGFELLGGSISDGHLGMDIVRANGPDGIFDDVLIDGTSFADLNRKGIYAEALSNAHITNITMTNVGEFGGITATGALGRGGNGVNVNLKYGSYDNILIDNFTLTDVGSSDRDGAMAEGDTNGGAIVIAARDDAPTYSPNPASATNVIVRDGTIDGTSTGVQLGEPGKANATPDLLVENVAISDAQHTLKHGDIGNQSAATMTVTGTSGADSLIASGNSDGPFVIDGGAGEDTIATGSAADQIEGGADDDVIDGGGGIDTAIVGSGATYSANGANWTVTSSDGSDTLTNVEIVDDAAAGKVLLVGSGGFTTIQAAIDAAADGDTILVAAGTYDEDIVIDVGVTILGAQHGVSVDGRDAAAGTGESTIIGDAKVTAAAGVTIDGIRFLNDATTSGNGPSNPALAFQTGGGVGGHNVTNSIFWSTLAGGAGGVDDRAISVNAIADGLVTIADNLISGASQGQFSTASWGRAIWFDGGGVDLVATGNTILWSRTGLNLDMSGDSTADVSGNTFHGLGTGISVGVDADGLTVSDNDHQQVGDDFNFRNLTTGVTFDAGEAIDTLTPVGNANDFVVVLGGSGADDLTGTAGADVLDGNNHPTLGSATDADTLDGAGGDDLLFGRGGDDELDGGTGIDTLTGGAGDDELAGGSEIDTAVYAGNIADYTITTITDGDGNVTGFSAVVDNNATGGDEGSDTLTSIEKLQFADATLEADAPVKLYDEGDALVGTFDTIQAAVDAASDGYTVLVAAGTYTENVTVDKDLTIEGPNAGTAATDTRVAEAIIDGGIYMHAAGATLDGLEVLGGASLAGNPAGIYVDVDDVTLTNLIVQGDGTAGTGILTLSGGGVTGLVLSDSRIDDWTNGTYFNPTTGFTASGNSFDGNGVALTGDDWADGTTISDNAFTDSSIGHVGYGVLDTVDDVGAYFGTGNTFDASGGRIGIFAYGDGDAGGQTITGTPFGDYMAGVENVPGSGIDGTFNGEGGDDLIEAGTGDDTLDGGAGDDTLDGGSGTDTMTGGADDDTYMVDAPSDSVIEADNEGTDTVQSSAAAYTLTAFVENLVLTGAAAIDGTGNGLANELTGNSAANRLDGGAAADEMTGAGGDDTYVVEVAGDAVTELAGGGNDTVESSIDYTLGSELERLILTGTALNGTGNGLANFLAGNASANTLIGGAGDDVMQGGAGDDLYFVDSTGDQVVELASEGTDTVRARANYTLSGDVENLILFGGGNISGTGNGLANSITGNAANNILDGGGGADTMMGGEGHDTYVVDNAGDVAVEAGSSGTDTVQSSIASYLLPVHFEKLLLTGTSNIIGRGNAGDNTITGNSGNNFLNGNSGNDTIDGGGGNDRLLGSFGSDTLTGGAGNDRFEFTKPLGPTNVDKILDFTVGEDKIQLLNTIFTGSGPNGTLAAPRFVAGTAAVDASDRIIYDGATGKIFYDSDGNGAAAQIHFATVTAGTALTHADFVLFGA